nr:hypothetical protein [Planococcus glaciei]
MKQEILQTALVQFANEGYEGASLGKIADAVGIKNLRFMPITPARMNCFCPH